jgi:DNA polymerase-1
VTDHLGAKHRTARAATRVLTGEARNLQDIHDFELALVEPCMGMLERGVKIDEARRRGMMVALEKQNEPLIANLQELVIPKLTPKTKNYHLFVQKWTCPCCRGGKIKSQKCWACAGFSSRPKKKALEVYNRPLEPCQQCEGKGRNEWLYFNPGSDPQKTVVLYDVLKLPRRVSVDEDTLKDLRAYDKSDVVDKLLKITKAATIVTILKRMEPGPDGRLRTWYNVAGTETGRFSSSATFLEVSTNLQNLPKKVAKVDQMYDVRNCVVPDEGMTLIEADLSQAEARVVAALCHDRDLLKRWEDPAFNVHKYTAAHIFGMPEDQVVENSFEYMIGKFARHALNYKMGWKTFMSEVNADADLTGISITARQAKDICSKYATLHPSLPRWWTSIDVCMGTFHRMVTIFGRMRTFHGRHGEGTLKEAIAFEPQSTVADLLNRGLLRWWQKYEGKMGQLLLQVHDSVLIQVPTSRAAVVAKVLRGCLEEEIEINGITLKIPADIAMSEESWARVS